ncbi:MAG: hypothetical protein NXH75_11830 [Halobacteriovoraceae bacterium]|jgi:hypothetical protein|nr:hypothetical protein [Halobacteriovoraceae bacterium]
MKKIFANQLMVIKILWGALLFSNLVFGFLVYSKMILAPESVTAEGFVQYLPYVLASGSLMISLLFFLNAMNFDGHKAKFNSLNVEQNNIQPQHSSQFEELDEDEKKRFMVLTQIMVKLIVSWALAESINIFGIVGIFLGLPTDQYWYFFTTGVGLMIFTFPKNIYSRLQNLRSY